MNNESKWVYFYKDDNIFKMEAFKEPILTPYGYVKIGDKSIENWQYPTFSFYGTKRNILRSILNSIDNAEKRIEELRSEYRLVSGIQKQHIGIIYE